MNKFIGFTISDFVKLQVGDGNVVRLPVSAGFETVEDIVSYGLDMNMGLEVVGMSPALKEVNEQYPDRGYDTVGHIVKAVPLNFSKVVALKLSQLEEVGDQVDVKVSKGTLTEVPFIKRLAKCAGVSVKVMRCDSIYIVTRVEDKAAPINWSEYLEMGVTHVHKLKEGEQRVKVVCKVRSYAANRGLNIKVKSNFNSISITQVDVSNKKPSYRSRLIAFVESLKDGESAMIPDNLAQEKSKAILRSTLNQLPIANTYRKGLVKRIRFQITEPEGVLKVYENNKLVGCLVDMSLEEFRLLPTDSRPYRSMVMQLMTHMICITEVKELK